MVFCYQGNKKKRGNTGSRETINIGSTNMFICEGREEKQGPSDGKRSLRSWDEI